MQTTRGTPLTGDADASWPEADGTDIDRTDTDRVDATRTGVGPIVLRRPKLFLLAGIAISVLVLDQLTKAVALTELAGREPIELLGGLLTLRLVFNPGAAFGIGQGYTVVLTAVMITVAIVILRVARNLASTWWAAALGLLLGGALGNLGDRLFRAPGPFEGHVIDFIDSPFTLVFNLADSAITSAGVVMIVLTFRGVHLDGTRGSDDRAAQPPGEAAAGDEPHDPPSDSPRD